MLIDERRQQVLKAIQRVKGLSRQDRQELVALDLPIYDSLVVAYLKVARILLERDSRFNWKAREDAWHTWRDEIMAALEGALRYHENDALIIAIGVCSSLFPVVHHGAALMAYKTLDDVVLAAQRTGYALKRERARQLFRVKDILRRISVWVCPPFEVIPDTDLSDDERAALVRNGGIEASGVALYYMDAATVARLVECVIPIWWQQQGHWTYIAPNL